MGFIAAILKGVATPAREPETPQERVARLERAMKKLAAEREATAAAIAAAAERRRDLLETDAPDAEIDAAETAADRGERALERIEAAERRLVEQLSRARDAVQRDRWAQLVDEHDAALGAFLDAARKLLPHADRVRTLWTEAEQFRAERMARMVLLPGPLVIDPAVLNHLEADFARVRGIAVAPPSPQPPRVPPRPKAKPQPVVEISARPPAPRPRRKPIADPAPKDGERGVIALRPGIELPDGRQLGVGDRVNLTAAAATELVRSGACEFVDALP